MLKEIVNVESVMQGKEVKDDEHPRSESDIVDMIANMGVSIPNG